MEKIRPHPSVRSKLENPIRRFTAETDLYGVQINPIGLFMERKYTLQESHEDVRRWSENELYDSLPYATMHEKMEREHAP